MTSSIFHAPNEGGLFDPEKLARRDDPSTSKAAAVKAAPVISGHNARILTALHDAPEGLTKDEIGSKVDLDGHQVGRRMGALRDRGLVYVVGTRKSPANRDEAVWCSVEVVP